MMASCAILYAGNSSQSIAVMPPPAQAQLISTFFRRSSIPKRLDFLPASDMCRAELDRRSSSNAAAQYVDLFRRAWRAAYPSLAALMPATSSGQDA
eukprot:840639-Pleurochrysis_carterae.AAC.1